MKKIILLFSFLLVIITTQAQQNYVDDFYRYAYANGIVLENQIFEFSVVSLETANGKSTKIHNHWLIEIDSEFYSEYHDKSQLKRLVFHELGHILLHRDDVENGSHIMNPSLIYYPLTDKLIYDLFFNNQN